VRILLFASGDFAIPTMRSLVDPAKPGHEIACVITQPDRASGRGRHSQPTPVRTMAEKLGLPVIASENVNAPDMIAQLADFNADLGLVIAFGQKIRAEVRTLYRHQCVNLHASLLPKYRGAAPFQWTVINGDEVAGVTVFRLVDRMDAGPVYLTRRTGIKEDERACELHDRLAMIGVDAVRATLNLLSQDPPPEPTPQDEALATTAPKLTKEDGYIRFDQPAQRIADRIHGLWDWPGAKCRFVPSEPRPPALDAAVSCQGSGSGPNQSAQTKTSASPNASAGETVTIALARVGDPAPAKEPPGTIDYRRYVATADGYLEILEIKPDGARLMAFHDFVNGRHIRAGDRFETIARQS